MYSGKYLFDRVTSIPADVALSYELIWRAPQRLDAESIVFLASYSGRTEDTLAALRFAREPRRAHGRAGRATPTRRSAPRPTTTHRLRLPRSVQPAAAGGHTVRAANGARPRATRWRTSCCEAVPALPGQIGEAFRNQRERGRELAAELADSTLLYAIGAGPLLRPGLQVRADGVHGEHADPRLGDRDRPSSATARPRCWIARRPIWPSCWAPTSRVR